MSKLSKEFYSLMKTYIIQCSHSSRLYAVDCLFSGSLFQFRLFPVSLEMGVYIPDRDKCLSKFFFDAETLSTNHIRLFARDLFMNYSMAVNGLSSIPYCPILATI